VYKFNELGDFQLEVNRAKELFLAQMVTNDIITTEQFNEMVESYSIVISKKNWLGQIISKIFQENDNGIYYNVVKILNSKKGIGKPNLKLVKDIIDVKN